MEGNGRPAWVSDVLAMEGRLLSRIDRLEDQTNKRLEKLEARLQEVVSDFDSRLETVERDHARWSLPRQAAGAALLAFASALMGALAGRFVS